MVFAKNTIYIAGNAKSPVHNAITLQYGQFLIGFVIDGSTGEIVACDASTSVQVTNEFIRTLFIGKNMLKDEDDIIQEVRERYFGSSQKAVLVAFKDAQKQFINIVQGLKTENQTSDGK
jgi:hypothetical protein